MDDLLFEFLWLYVLLLLLARRIGNRQISNIFVDLITMIVLFLAKKAYAPIADIDVIGTYIRGTYVLMILFAVNMIYNIYVLIKRKKQKNLSDNTL